MQSQLAFFVLSSTLIQAVILTKAAHRLSVSSAAAKTTHPFISEHPLPISNTLPTHVPEKPSKIKPSRPSSCGNKSAKTKQTAR
jgi:hypothetical protein